MSWRFVVVVSVIAAVGIGWLIWAAAAHARPAVSGDVHVWQVISDSEAGFTLTVDRRDPAVPVSCRVTATAPDHQTVGEKTIDVAPAETRLVDIRETMRTLRRATSVSLDRCWVS